MTPNEYDEADEHIDAALAALIDAVVAKDGRFLPAACTLINAVVQISHRLSANDISKLRRELSLVLATLPMARPIQTLDEGSG
jgi:hypothetical protein